MMPGGEKIDEYPQHDQGCSEPQGQPVRRDGLGMLNELELAQEEAESRHYKTKAHQGQAGSNPGKKGTFRGQRIAQISGRHGFPHGCYGLFRCPSGIGALCSPFEFSQGTHQRVGRLLWTLFHHPVSSVLVWSEPCGISSSFSRQTKVKERLRPFPHGARSYKL